MKNVIITILLVFLIANFALASAPAIPSDWGDIPEKAGWIDKGDRWFDPQWNLTISKDFTPWMYEAYLYRISFAQKIQGLTNKYFD